MKEKSDRIIEDFTWLTPPEPVNYSLWIWVGILALVIGVGIFLLLRIRKNRGGLSFFPPAAPHETALKALRDLTGLLKEDSDREFIAQISLILRVYIQDQFGIRAPHRSTEEFLREARVEEALDEKHQELLASFLAHCDLVKFAQRRTVLQEMQALFHSAKNFIETTVPVEKLKVTP